MDNQGKDDGNKRAAPRHVGGINDSLGGVDPDIDETLMRLSGGP